jgi:hypothetical protein
MTITDRRVTLAVLVPRGRPTGVLSFAEAAARCGVHVTLVERLVRVGVLEPHPEHPSYLPPETTLRLRKMVRLNRDLGVNWEGAALIVELLERVEQLEDELAARRGKKMW